MFPYLHTCPTYEDGQSVWWPLSWERPKKYEPTWLRLCEKNVEAVYTANLDDVECFIAWLNYMREKGLTGYHISSCKYLTPVEQARAMLELTKMIEDRTTTPWGEA